MPAYHTPPREDDNVTSEHVGELCFPSARLGALTRKINEIKSMLSDEHLRIDDLLAVKAELLEKLDNYKDHCRKSESSITDSIELKKFVEWRDSKVQNCMDCLLEVDNWISTRDGIDDIVPGDSASQSGKSVQSSISMMSQLVERQIKCEIKQRKLEEEFKIKEKAIEAKNEYDKLKLKLEKEKLRLETRYEQEEVNRMKSELNLRGSKIGCGSVRSKLSATRVFVPKTEPIRYSSDNLNILNPPINMHSLYLPRIEPETFDGKDITKYSSFVLAFDQIIARSCTNDTDKYYYLLRYTTGHPHELVKSCLCSDVGRSYQNAKDMLRERYGNEVIIAQSYIDRLEKWPSLNSEDSQAFDEFAMYLTSVSNLMCNSDHLSQLNSWKEIHNIVMKLPFDLRKKFRSKVSQYQEKGLPLNFTTIVKFVNSEARALKMPMFGEIKDSQLKSVGISGKQVRHEKTFATAEMPETVDDCLCCGKSNHGLDSCFFFMRKSLNEREDLIRSKNLCFGCLASTNHRSSECNNKLICKKCGKRHPTSLHKEAKMKIETSDPTHESRAMRATTTSISRILCPTVPVGIRRKGTDEIVITNMAMDTFATSSYMDENLLTKLNMKGRPAKLSLTTMESESSVIPVTVIENLEIVSLDGGISDIIPRLYAKGSWPFDIKDSPVIEDIEPYSELKKIPFNFVSERVGLLVGMNVPNIVKPLDVINTTSDGPYATRHAFGWALNGPVKGSKYNKLICCRTKAEDVAELHTKIEKYFSRDFEDQYDEEVISRDDQLWQDKVIGGIRRLPNGQIEIPLPFREDPNMPNNRQVIVSRLESLRKSLSASPQKLEQYVAFMKDMRDKGYAEEVPPDEDPAPAGKVWYLPHHGVYHKQKKTLRVVFDCSAKYHGVSINDFLLQGPDLINNLVGVLLRFRSGLVAFSGDVEKMFYRVRVPKNHSDFLRFLWFEGDDINCQPIEYRINVHVFGAKSSPSCANFALKHSIATFNDLADGSAVRDILSRSFYVDDLMVSASSESVAIDLIDKAQTILGSSGFNLTGFCSNSRNVLNSLPKDKLSKNLKASCNFNEVLPSERALGLMWDAERDKFCYEFNESKSGVFTKRGILSDIFSIYDPFFIVAPVVIPAKSIFQQTCARKLNWDDPLPRDLADSWKRWLSEIKQLNNFEIDRCFCNDICDSYDRLELHIFSDGSETAYGSVAYLRFVAGDVVRCTIVMSKVRLTPVSKGALRTIPRIELNAARLSIMLYLKLKKELNLEFSSVHYWTDSLIVLGYIHSESGKFQRFVTNRVAFVRNHSHIDQWHYVPGTVNPADMLSRGVSSVNKFLCCRSWVAGPQFLYQPENEWPVHPGDVGIPPDDEEIIHKAKVVKDEQSADPTERLLTSTSCWLKLRYRVSAMLRLFSLLKTGEVKSGAFSVDELVRSEIAIWRASQIKYFATERAMILRGHPLPKKSVLTKISPFIDEEGLMRAGGRLQNSDLPYSVMHPIILSKNSWPVEVFITQFHRNLGHLGRQTVASHLKEFFIVGGNALIKRICNSCVACRKIQARPSIQYMANLPTDRVSGDLPPFTSTGIDFFGPFMVSKGRGRVQEKRYGVVFSCLASRACHLEIAHSLDTDSFVNALRRFFCRRGVCSFVRSDNGTNLVSGSKEINKSVEMWNEKKIVNFCNQKRIEWKFNPPYSSHYGGVYEREIRTIRKVLNALMSEHCNRIAVNDEMLLTLMCEVENTLNSRPIGSASVDDEPEPLTPNHVLRLNTSVLFPPGIFQPSDLYSKRRWRQVQHLADVFWQRWRREYLPLLIQRQKWSSPTRVHELGDIVLIVDNTLPRNMWSLGRIVKIVRNNNDHIRSVMVKVSTCKNGKNLSISSNVIERPIHKLVLLSES